MILLLMLVLAAAPRSAADSTATPSAAVAAPRDSSAVRDSSTARAPLASDALADELPWRLTPVQEIVGSGTGRGQVMEPSGLTTDAFGRIYVADAAQHRVQQFGPDGSRLWEVGTLGSDPGELRRPMSVAAIGTLSIGVLDVENRRVDTWDLFGRWQGVLIDLAQLEDADPVGRIDAIAMATDRGGAVFVADAERDRVIAFDFSGRVSGVIGGIGTRPGSFRGLRGLAVSPRGELVCTERANGRVQRLTAGGRALASWPLDVKPGRALLPAAIDDSARVAVADEATGRLWMFDARGALLARADGLAGPRALAFAGDGSLLVAEARAGIVRRWRLVPARAADAGAEH